LATSKGQQQYYPGSSNKFTLTFQNAGTYKYLGLDARFGYIKVNSLDNFSFLFYMQKRKLGNYNMAYQNYIHISIPNCSTVLKRRKLAETACDHLLTAATITCVIIIINN
jgi:hypothetical protein